MTLVTLVPVELVLNTASADLPDAIASGTTSITSATDGCTIPDLSAYHSNQVLLKLIDTAGATVTFTAGDNPPAIRTGVAFTITLAANDVKYIVLDLARFMQDDGTVHFVTGTTTSGAAVFIMPRGA